MRNGIASWPDGVPCTSDRHRRGAFLEILLAGPAGARVATFVEQDQVAAPQLFDAKVFHRLLRLEKTGGLHSDAVTTGLADLADAPITRYPHGPLFDAARRFASALSGYDALYTALAALLDGVLMTVYARFARTVSERFGLTVTCVATSGP